jgi:polysaccharide biosynthesis/export protein
MKHQFLALAVATALLPFCAFAQVGGERVEPRYVGMSAEPIVRNGPAAVVQPGDGISLRIWNEPEMSGTFTVAQDGHVILPRLGSTRVEGIEIVELQKSLRESYGAFLRNPSVDVVVLRRISVLGEVRQPGIYLADLTMGIPELIAMSGGPTETGDPNRVLLIRDSQRIEFDRRRQGQMFVAELYSGDQIYVPQRNFFVRNGVTLASAALAILTTLLLR